MVCVCVCVCFRGFNHLNYSSDYIKYLNCTFQKVYCAHLHLIIIRCKVSQLFTTDELTNAMMKQPVAWPTDYILLFTLWDYNKGKLSCLVFSIKLISGAVMWLIQSLKFVFLSGPKVGIQIPVCFVFFFSISLLYGLFSMSFFFGLTWDYCFQDTIFNRQVNNFIHI